MGQFLQPAYGDRSLGDVVPAVAAALGLAIDGRPTGLLLPDAPAYVVFLVDGLGARLLERYAHAAPFLASLLAEQAPGTAGVPSTTATSLTSLGTGLPPHDRLVVGDHPRLSWDGRRLGAVLLLGGAAVTGPPPPPTPGSRVVNFTRTGEKQFAALFGNPKD